MTTDEALTEQIARAIASADGVGGPNAEYIYSHYAAAVLPIIRKAQAAAAREALVKFRKGELAIIPLDADEDSPIRVRQQALAWRIEMHLLANYPEESR